MTTNAQRQAAFKARMRSQGKRQITVWVTDAQAQAIKTYLEGHQSLPETPPESITTKPGPQGNETIVYRDGKQLGSVYKVAIDSYPRPKTRWRVYRYGKILSSGTFRTKREAIGVLKASD